MEPNFGSYDIIKIYYHQIKGNTIHSITNVNITRNITQTTLDWKCLAGLYFFLLNSIISFAKECFL